MVAKDDPEKLLAEALRAQAVGQPTSPSPDIHQTTSHQAAQRDQAEPQKSLSVWVIALYAILLGLAAGSLMGLLSLW